eukprot:9478434-Pyramimonas_sp.AAC.3
MFTNLLQTVRHNSSIANVDPAVAVAPAVPRVGGAVVGADRLVARRAHSLELGGRRVQDHLLREVVGSIASGAWHQHGAVALLVPERQTAGDVSYVADGVDVDVGQGEGVRLHAEGGRAVEVPRRMIVLRVLRCTVQGSIFWSQSSLSRVV